MTEGRDIRDPEKYSKRAEGSEVLGMVTKYNAQSGGRHTYICRLDRKNFAHDYLIQKLANNADEQARSGPKDGGVIVEVLPGGCLQVLNNRKKEGSKVAKTHIAMAKLAIEARAQEVRLWGDEATGLAEAPVRKERNRLRHAMYRTLQDKLDLVQPLPPGIDAWREAELKNHILPALKKAKVDTCDRALEAMVPLREFCDKWVVEEYRAQPLGGERASNAIDGMILKWRDWFFQGNANDHELVQNPIDLEMVRSLLEEQHYGILLRDFKEGFDSQRPGNDKAWKKPNHPSRFLQASTRTEVILVQLRK